MYVEATGNFPGVGPYTITTPQYLECVGEVKFSYHMYGSGMGTLELQMSSDGGVNWATTWTKTGDQGNSWQHATVTATPFAHQVRFVGTTGTSYTSDMAIDNFNIAPNIDCSLPTPAPTLSALPTPSPTLLPTPTPTPAPTFSPTRTPVVNTQVGMSGLNCSGFSATIFNTALDMLVPNSTFSDSVCADAGALTIMVTTEVTTPRSYINYGADSSDLAGHVTVLLESAVSDGTFESTIQALATSSRRLGASDAHPPPADRGGAAAQRDPVVASTFPLARTIAVHAAPTPAPSESPVPADDMPTVSSAPTPKPTFSVPPTSSPTAPPFLKSSSASTNELALILGVGALLLLGVGAMVMMCMHVRESARARARDNLALFAVTACF